MDSWMRMLRLRLRALFKSGSKESELEREMQFHLESHIEENIQMGMAPKEARKDALKEFGGYEKYKDDCRDSWGTRVVSELGRDIAFSARSLWKSKGFSFAVIATLALCIGANTTIFSSLYHLVLKPLPFKDADRIVHIYNFDNRVKATFPIEPLFDRATAVSPFTIAATGLASVGQYLDYKEKATLFEGFAILNSQILNVSKEGGIQQVRGLNVSHGIFDLLGVKPLIGRFFGEEESTPGNNRVIVLPESVWRSEFDADPGVLGQKVTVNVETSFTIIGVAPKSMEVFEYRAKFFTPFVMQTGGYYEKMAGRIWIAALWGKLKEGVSCEAAQSQLQLIEQETIRNETALNADFSVPLSVGHLLSIDHRPQIGRSNPLKAPLFVLQAGAVFVMMIGCVNIINLLLSRAISKVGELSVRHALGAGRSVLARLLILESMMLALMAILLGCFIAWGGLESVNAYLTVTHPKSSPARMDSHVLITMLSLSCILAFVMGLAPFTILWRAGRIQKIESGIRSVSASRGVSILNRGLVVFQVAVAFILIVGAGLLFRSFWKVLNVDSGIDAKEVIQIRIHIMNYDKFRKVEGAVASLREEFIGALREIPGIVNVSTAVEDSLSINRSNAFMIGGIDYMANDEPLPLARPFMVDENFFETMGIEILEGETFLDNRRSQSHGHTYILGKGIVDRYFENKSAIGSIIAFVPGTDARTFDPLANGHRVIGVADRATFAGLEERDGIPLIYSYWTTMHRDAYLFIRTTREVESIGIEIRRKLAEVDSNIIIKDIRSVKILLDEKHLDRQVATLLIGCFAGLALVLSGIGLYSVLANSVLQRRKEIGVRMAVGATARKILEMIIKQGMLCVGIGIGLGVFGAILLGRFLESQLFDISPFDPVTYVAVLVFFLIVGLAATIFPALRAFRLDPIEILRSE